MSNNKTKRARRNRKQTAKRPGQAVIKVLNATSYDSARTSPDYRKHWIGANSLSVDASLNPYVRRIQRERARYEIANNPYAYGAAMTLANAVIGAGARLQVIMPDNDKELSARIEGDFSQWADDIRLAEKLRAMRFARFQDGESFGVLYNNATRPANEVRLDLAPIDCERVCAKWNETDPLNVDGIQLDKWGNPVTYRVLTEHPGNLGGALNQDETIYKAENIVHWFRKSLPEQHRGCSEISPALECFADLDRYTKAVVTAAETAADLAIVFYTDTFEDTGGFDVDNYSEIENAANAASSDANPFPEIPFSRGMNITAPVGFKPSQVKAEQPTTTYPAFVDELLGQIGAALGLPRLLIKHCAAGYNYASGRLDFQEYHRFIQLNQKSCVTAVLNPLFKAWFKEWQLVNGVRITRRPITVWNWDGFEHVDPLKEANAQAVRLNSLTTTLAAEYGKAGKDWEDELTQLARERAKIKELEQEYGIELQPKDETIRDSDSDGDGN